VRARLLTPLAAGLAAVLLLGGCGEDPSPTATDPAGDDASSSPVTADPGPTSSATPGISTGPAGPTDHRGKVRFTGTVTRADVTCVDVEAGSAGVYALVDGTGAAALADLEVGDEVTVTGTTRVPGDQPHATSYDYACGGPPVLVAQVQPAVSPTSP
jgi:hypothetical protein